MSDKISKYEGNIYPYLWGRLFDNDFFGFNQSNMPAVNIKETKKEFKLEISAPGFDKQDFDVQVNKNMLTVSATSETSSEEKGDDEKVLRREFSTATFSRSFTLPDNVDTEKITAKEKNGVLHVSLPKKEDAKEKVVKRIEIK